MGTLYVTSTYYIMKYYGRTDTTITNFCELFKPIVNRMCRSVDYLFNSVARTPIQEQYITSVIRSGEFK